LFETGHVRLCVLKYAVHVRLVVTAHVLVTGHLARLQAGGEHVVVGSIAARAFRATYTRDVAVLFFFFDFGFEWRNHETAQTHRPDRV